MLTSLVGVIILLGGLIFFHELGHFSVAKFFNVKVEVFSIGFGKKFFRRKWGETEYCLSLFPLGGYVKMMGDDPYKGVPAADAERAFSTQKLYKRFLIVAAGPIANLLLAYVLYMVVFWSGQEVASTRLAAVQVNSIAWDAGLRAKDRVLEVAGKPVQNWPEMEDALKGRAGEKVEFRVRRGSEDLRIPVEVTKIKGRNEFGEEVLQDGVKGLSQLALQAMVGISQVRSLPYQAGLRTGDVVTKVNAQAIEQFEDMHEALASVWKEGEPVTFSVQRKQPKSDDAPTEHSFTFKLPKKPAALPPLGLTEVLGIYPSDVFVLQLSPGSPAEKGGLQPGDQIVRVAEHTIYGFEAIGERVQEAGAKGETIPFVIERAGQSVTLALKPNEITQTDPITQTSFKKFIVGFSPQAAYREPEAVDFRIRDPLKLISYSVDYTHNMARTMAVSLAKLAMGQLSVKSLGGPVLIADLAGKSLNEGATRFLFVMAAISINLFLLNLFPIPVLDGGHLVFFCVEAIKGKPVSVRTMELANQVGMVFILALVGLTFFNDISRYVIN